LATAACVLRRAAAAFEIFYDYFIASTKFEGTSEYDNTKTTLFIAVLLLSISFNLWDQKGAGSLDAAAVNY
jgi:hypothetical protein